MPPESAQNRKESIASICGSVIWVGVVLDKRSGISSGVSEIIYGGSRARVELRDVKASSASLKEVCGFWKVTSLS
jgi:hypothetical protein